MSTRKRLSNWAASFGRRSTTVGQTRRQHRRRLLVEQMEDRRMLAVIDLAALTAGQGTVIY